MPQSLTVCGTLVDLLLPCMWLSVPIGRGVTEISETLISTIMSNESTIPVVRRVAVYVKVTR
jgi:hypothetical protein